MPIQKKLSYDLKNVSNRGKLLYNEVHNFLACYFAVTIETNQLTNANYIYKKEPLKIVTITNVALL